MNFVIRFINFFSIRKWKHVDSVKYYKAE